MRGKDLVKKCIFILLILLMILITIIIICKKRTARYVEEVSDPVFFEETYIIKETDNRSDCFTAMKIAKVYINYLVGEYKNTLLNVISLDYINNELITEENVLEKIKDKDVIYSENYYVLIENILMSHDGDKVLTFLMDILYYNKDNNQKYNIKLMVQMDTENNTYQIIPYQYMKKKGYNELKVGNICNTNVTKIENRKDNTYKSILVYSNSMPNRYFNLYFDYIKYDKERSYYLLNEEYREKRFVDIEDYINFLNTFNFDDIYLENYDIYSYEDYTQYVCRDNEGKYYIFNETYPMQFDLILDTYTIDLPQFITKYESADDNTKVALNVEKIREAINVKDFQYVFNKTDETFRNAKFKNYNDFENYFTSKLFNENSFKYKKIEKQASVYIVTVEVTNSKNTREKPKEIEIIMKLTDSTDYLISFNLER